MEHKKFPLFADHITTFMVNTLLLTTDVVMGHKEKKELVKNFINPELCEITEDLVYTEPFFDCPRNEVLGAAREFAKSEIWGDEGLLLETAKLKFKFMSNAQSLLHGDLHTGSIFIKEDSTKVIDPEFAFYGPAGYDIGNVIANAISHSKFAVITMENHSTIGGLGSIVAEKIAELGLAKRLTKIGIRDTFIHSASKQYLMKEYKLD